MRTRPLVCTIATIAVFAIAGCGDDNGGNDNNGGGTPVRTSTPGSSPAKTSTPATTPTGVTETPTGGATGTTPAPTPTGGGAGVCEGAALNVTVTTDPGSDLDTGWTGIAHNSVATEGSTVTTQLNCVGNDCTVDGTALVGMPFGPPLPLSSGGVPVCVLNSFREAVTGTYNCETGCSESSVKILSKVFLVQDIAQPCPICNGDPTPNDGQKGGTCAGGTATVGAPCDVGGTSPQFGATSNDCLPTGSSVGELAIDINPLSTGTVTQTGNGDCVAATSADDCYCPSQNRGNACDSGICPASGVCEGGPIDAFCSVQKFRSCLTDQDCEATFPGSGTCVQAPRPCFGDTITRQGTCGTQSGTLVGFFCIPATRAPAINTTAGLPGPGALSLPAHQVRTVR
jgi:hypothetical protein